MKVSEVIPDQITEMTPELYQEFCIGGCVPMCHLNLTPIKIGEKFKLATVDVAVQRGSNNFNTMESQEVMLSENANVNAFLRIQNDKIYQEQKRRKKGGGCFRVNGKIVTA